MARPTKKGLNYFPFDTTMDKKMNLIMRRFGRDGYYIITRLFSCLACAWLCWCATRKKSEHHNECQGNSDYSLHKISFILFSR